MPELPEVETIRQTLRALVLDKQITDISVYWPKLIKQPDDVSKFKFLIQGQKIEEIGRKGKFLLFFLTDYVLVSHLRMEGKYGVFSKNDPIKKHTHVVFHFSDDTELRYNDVRKFGTMHLSEKGQELLSKPLTSLGPDPFESSFDFDVFFKKVQKSERAIKNILLDQTVIAGLGNIYVDETLFKAGVHPQTSGSTLSRNTVLAIKESATQTLAEAVKQGGTTIRSYVNTQGQIGMFQQQLFVYGQQNKPCRKCGTPIEKMKLGGRGTHFCPICQK